MMARRDSSQSGMLSSASRKELTSIRVRPPKGISTKHRVAGPRNTTSLPLFDDDFPEEEQLPRELEIEFRKVKRGKTDAVVLRCNGLNFGDRVTDNIGQADFYRFHDVFHFAYVVFLGWSPVIRALLKCKRKSDPLVDENQDGARATIVEEAVSAMVFSRAKEMDYYGGVDHVDYDLLKAIREFIQGFEVAGLPLWQWETAILEGYRAFRFLRENEGGCVTLDMNRRELLYRTSSGKPWQGQLIEKRTALSEEAHPLGSRTTRQSVDSSPTWVGKRVWAAGLPSRISA